MVKKKEFVSIPRDNYFYACTYLCKIIAELEQGFSEREFEGAGVVTSSALDGSAFESEINAVLALLVDTFPEEANRALASYLSEQLCVEFEDGLIFAPETRAVETATEQTIHVPVAVCHKACEDLFVSEVLETIPTVTHALKNCLRTLEAWIGKNKVRKSAYADFQKTSLDIVVDIWKA